MDEHDDGPDLDDLRRLVHERVDAVFDQVDGPLGVEGAALQLCAQLLKAAEPFIDLHVGREFSARAVKSPAHALTIGRAQRERMKAARYLVDVETPASTARGGLIGASILRASSFRKVRRVSTTANPLSMRMSYCVAISGIGCEP